MRSLPFPASRPFLYTLLALLALVALTACSGNADWKRGKELLAAGQYVQASEALRAALKSEPDNIEIKADLAGALAPVINGESYGEYSALLAALEAAGMADKAKALVAISDPVGKQAFLDGDTGLTGLAAGLFNAGDASLELPVLWAMRYDANLIRAHYPTLEMPGKAERFAAEITWSADDIPGAEAGLALLELDPTPQAIDQMLTKLGFMLTSDNAEAVALADKALQAPPFEPEKVYMKFDSAHLNGQPGSPSRKAGFSYRVKNANPISLAGFLINLTIGVTTNPQAACSSATHEAAMELAAFLGEERSAEAMATQQGDTVRTIAAAGLEAARASAAGEIPAETCVKTWEGLKAKAGG